MLLQPSYFASILQYIVIGNTDELTFEIHDNFQKQSYRNRCYIYGANGKQQLTIPIVHIKNGGKQKSKDIKIDNSFTWQKIQVKALQSAYRSSPFFEFYEDDIWQLFNKKYKFLLDLNFDTLAIIGNCMEMDSCFSKTVNYQLNDVVTEDYRFLVNAKSPKKYALNKYKQVFDDKHGFIPDLSILDLLFNEGPNALEYLENHKSLLNELSDTDR